MCWRTVQQVFADGRGGLFGVNTVTRESTERWQDSTPRWLSGSWRRLQACSLPSPNNRDTSRAADRPLGVCPDTGSSIPAPGPCIVFEAASRGCSPSRDRVLIEGAGRPPRAAPFVLSTFPFSTKGWIAVRAVAAAIAALEASLPPSRSVRIRPHYRLEELPTRKAHFVETLLLGAVIRLLVSRRLLLAVQERLRRTSYKMPEQRWAAIFAAVAPAIRDTVLLPPRV